MMNCPVCDGRLRAIEKYGVEIDICPDCKGIWLDRGELEKILELEAVGGPATERNRPRNVERSPADVAPQSRRESHDDDDDDHDRRRSYPAQDQHGRPPQKRRGSWIGDLLGGLGGDD